MVKGRSVIYNCDSCGKEKTTKQSMYVRSKHHFCSNPCRKEHRKNNPDSYGKNRINHTRDNIKTSKEDADIVDINNLTIDEIYIKMVAIERKYPTMANWSPEITKYWKSLVNKRTDLLYESGEIGDTKK